MYTDASAGGGGGGPTDQSKRTVGKRHSMLDRKASSWFVSSVPQKPCSSANTQLTMTCQSECFLGKAKTKGC